MNPSERKRILLFGYLPPPYFGPSTACQTLMRSEFARHFDVTFINLSVVPDISKLETFRVAKLVKLVKFFLIELFYLTTRRFDFCCYPVSFNRQAFLKDALLLAAARARGVPTVLWAHGNNLPDFHQRSPRWMQRLIDWTVGNAAGAIVLGERLRFNFQQQLPDERIFSAPLGIELWPETSVTRAVDGFVVLYLGNLIPEKGVPVLLQAIPGVLRKQPDAQFVFAGAWLRERDRREAEELVRQSGIQEHVKFPGVVTGEAKRRLLVEADIFAMPTSYHLEAHPNVLLEALQAGLPVVSTARGTIPEIIEDGLNGLLVRERDPDDLAEKIIRLAADPELRKRMAAANRMKFANFYTREHYGRRMIAVFEALSVQRPGLRNTQNKLTPNG